MPVFKVVAIQFIFIIPECDRLYRYIQVAVFFQNPSLIPVWLEFHDTYSHRNTGLTVSTVRHVKLFAATTKTFTAQVTVKIIIFPGLGIYK